MTGPAYSTRRFAFAAGHRYWVDAWSAAENERRFGRLAVPHGHNYTVEVTVRGPLDERTGMVIDLGELKRIVTETVVERRSEERRVGKECFVPCRSRWSPYH